MNVRALPINVAIFFGDELDREVRKNCLTSEAELWKYSNIVWQQLQPEKLHKLVERMSRIRSAIIKADGKHFFKNIQLKCVIKLYEKC